jgi:hypothetical protein
MNHPGGGVKVEDPTNALCIGRSFFFKRDDWLKIEILKKNPRLASLQLDIAPGETACRSDELSAARMRRQKRAGRRRA